VLALFTLLQGAAHAAAARPLWRQLLPGLVVGAPGALLLWYGLRRAATEAAAAARTPGGAEAPLRLGFATIAGALFCTAGALAMVDVLAEFVRGVLVP
jgi:hypothetical protein